MRSTIDIVAECRAGATAVTTIRGGGPFAGRLTAPGVVHLIGTAAGPLGGDEAVIRIIVKAGACLTVRSAAATIVLPGQHQPDSVLRIEGRVEADGQLDLALEPTVVCAGAVHHSELRIELSGDAQVTVAEDVVLGRSGEPGGDWSGRTWLTRDGRPILRHLIRSRILRDGVRAVATRLDSRTPDDAMLADGRASSNAVRMPLAAGGVLSTGIGPSLLAARADLAELICVRSVGVLRD